MQRIWTMDCMVRSPSHDSSNKIGNKKYIISWEPKGHYHYSDVCSIENQKGAITIQMYVPLRARRVLSLFRCMFHWEPEGCYHYSDVRSIESQMLSLFRCMFHWEPEGRYHYSDVCSIENQKGAITIQMYVPLRARRVLSLFRCTFHWEPEGCYHYSDVCSIESQKGAITIQMYVPLRTRRVLSLFRCMFHWEPEGCYHHRLCSAIAPLWFSTEKSLNIESALLALIWWYSLIVQSNSIIQKNKSFDCKKFWYWLCNSKPLPIIPNLAV